MGIHDVIDSLRYPSYNCVRVNKGTYSIGNGMGGGTPIYCSWKVIKGEVTTQKLKTIRVRNGDHDRTISHLGTFVVYPKINTAIVEISNRYGNHRIRLVRCKEGQRSKILKERL